MFFRLGNLKSGDGGDWNPGICKVSISSSPSSPFKPTLIIGTEKRGEPDELDDDGGV